MEGLNRKYGVFWTPSGNMERLVSAWKSKVALLEPDAAYLHHPPHSTFFLLQTDKEAELVTTFRQLKWDVQYPEINIKGWRVFEKDAVTGGETLCLEIENSASLRAIQLEIARSLSPLRTGAIPYDNAWQGAFKSSYDLWGFPFVGAHWIPHVTIASVGKEGKQLIPDALNNEVDILPECLQQLNLYRIDQDNHICVSKINF